MDEEKFEYTYKAPTKREIREAQRIKAKFLPKDSDVAEFEALKRKAYTLPKAFAVAIGVIGTLVFGGGMALALSYGKIVAGTVVGLAGMAVMLANYPIYSLIEARRKKKYGARLRELAGVILQKKDL